jgi:hypothetical protein
MTSSIRPEILTSQESEKIVAYRLFGVQMLSNLAVAQFLDNSISASVSRFVKGLRRAGSTVRNGARQQRRRTPRLCAL